MNDTTERFLAYLAYKTQCERVSKKYPEKNIFEAVSFSEWIDAWIDDTQSWDE